MTKLEQAESMALEVSQGYESVTLVVTALRRYREAAQMLRKMSNGNPINDAAAAKVFLDVTRNIG
jgi:hypothetical protein